MKILLTILGLLFICGCNETSRYPLPDYFQRLNKDAPIRHVDKITEFTAGAGSTIYGLCEMSNKKDNFPITIRTNTFAYSQEYILQHELSHRFDAIMYDRYFKAREKFIHDLSEELQRGYDVEDLPAIVAQIQADKEFMKKYIVWAYLRGDYNNGR